MDVWFRAGRGALCTVSSAMLIAACGGGPAAGSAPAPGSGATQPAAGPDGGIPDAGPASAWDPASLDPRISATLSTDPACAGLGPRAPAPAPTRVLRAFAGTRSACDNGATTNARGDVAFACMSTFPERGWNELYSSGGVAGGNLPSWTLAAPTPAGFASAYTPFGPKTTSFAFSWRDDSGWHSADDSAVAAQRILFAHPSAGILELWVDAGTPPAAATRWVDPHGNPVRAARSWPGVAWFGPGTVDGSGRALVTYRTGDPIAGDFRARWLEPDDSVAQEFTLPDPSTWSGPVEPLAGSGLVFGRAFVVRSGATVADPVPGWLAPRVEPVAVVNGGRGYAFGKVHGDAPCDPTVRLYSADGTACGTVDLFGPGDSCPQVADIGTDGTLVQSVPAGRSDENGNPQTIWRWWPGLFR